MSTGVVIVSGGTFGLGRAVSLELAARGFQVTAFGLDDAHAASLRDEKGVDVLTADVSNADDVQRVIDHALARHGRIDGLVNNAAIGPLGTIADTDEATWDRIIAVNLKGAYLCSRAVLPVMRAQGGGAIVNVGSGAGWGKPNMAAYAASKGGLAALNAAMAYDHFHDRIRVNMVIPGGGAILSGMSLGRVGGDMARFGQGVPGSVAGRPIDGRDLAAAVAFLLSDDAATISGTVIDVGCFANQGGPVPPKPTNREA